MVKNILITIAVAACCTAVCAQERVNFTLHNSGLKSIPLKILGVMYPNLSPLSDSGVALSIGQKVFYKKKRKNFLLLVVDESYEGQKIDVAKLVKQKKYLAIEK